MLRRPTATRTLFRAWRSAPIDTLTELRQLADDLIDLGDYATEELVRKAIGMFEAWRFAAGEELLEKALEQRGHFNDERPPSPYFNTCVIAVA